MDRVRTNSGPARGVQKYAVALIVIGGAIWVLAGLSFSLLPLLHGRGALFGSSGHEKGLSVEGYPPLAVSDLLWAQAFFGLVTGAIGVLVIMIALTAFRRGEKWAWFAMLVFVCTAITSSVLSTIEFGGWQTFIPYGLLPLLGLVFSAKRVFARNPTGSLGNRVQQTYPDNGER